MRAYILTAIPNIALVAAGAITSRAIHQEATAVCNGSSGFKCVSQFYFTLCNGDNSVAQMVAPGTQCVNDQITFLNGSTTPPSTGGNSTAHTSTGPKVTTFLTSASQHPSTTKSSSSHHASASTSAPFGTGNSTTTPHASGTGSPHTSRTFTTRTATSSKPNSASISASASVSGSGSSGTTSSSRPAITTPGTGLAPGIPTSFATSIMANPSVDSGKLVVIPVTNLR